MSQALYRRYRPETFAEVIGQEHVTEPLQQALRTGRVSHAYLFSGPRGCGKTTSARILARCLNCAQGPTPTPCGTCDSCRALARGGPGHIDVIEIDAASHGGVDDARELREKAFFAPAVARHKIYIIDEAHMVTPQGFNALLKIVEEPPPHLKFIFATTAPDKVIGTIRSRTHHYPFRLVPPALLARHLGEVCEREGVTAETGVLPLVVRAGAGSVRDALSVLDQLVAGAGAEGVTYRLAVGLLGFTDAALLDDTVEALAAGDGAAVFTVVDRVIEAGHDPRRFAEDLLERLRDLIVLMAVPDAAETILADVPADQLERMLSQAGRFGSAELSRAADLLSVGIPEMRGTTAPRLHLELMCARVLLPAATHDERSLYARLDRLERRIALGAPSPTDGGRPAGSAPPTTAATGGPDVDARRGDATPATVGPASDPSAAAAEVVLDVGAVRGMWTEVLGRLAGLKRTTWTLVSQNATVADVGPGRLTLAFSSAGLRDAFSRGAHPELVRQALIDVLGLDATVEAIVDPSAGSTPATAPRADRPAAGGPGAPRADRPAAGGPGAPRADRPAAGGPGTRASPAPGAPPTPPAAGWSPTDDPAPAGRLEDDRPSADDPDVVDAGLSGRDLLVRELGATVIGEYDEP